MDGREGEKGMEAYWGVTQGEKGGGEGERKRRKRKIFKGGKFSENV